MELLGSWILVIAGLLAVQAWRTRRESSPGWRRRRREQGIRVTRQLAGKPHRGERLPRITNGRVELNGKVGGGQRPGGYAQAAVEFALVIPLFLFILLGGLQVGLALLQLEQLNHAARQSAIMLTTGNADLTAILAASAPSNTQVASVTPCGGPGTIAQVALTWDATGINFIPMPMFPTALAATGAAACTT